MEPTRDGPAGRENPVGGEAPADVNRLNHAGTAQIAPPADDEQIYRIVDALDGVAKETAKTVAQIAINRVLQRPSVPTVIIGARDETQLRQNLAAAERPARRAERQATNLSLLAPGAIRGAESLPDDIERRLRLVGGNEANPDFV